MIAATCSDATTWPDVAIVALLMAPFVILAWFLTR